MRIYITGVSGTGKTSLARILSKRGINAIDMDELSHWANKKTKEKVDDWNKDTKKEWFDLHEWVCDIKKLKSIISKTKDSVALGNASNDKNYLELFDKVFVLTCSPETVLSRVTQRKNNDFGKTSVQQKMIIDWQNIFDEQMVKKGAIKIDAEKPLNEIAREILSYFD